LSVSGLKVGSIATILDIDQTVGDVTLQLPTRETTLERSIAEHLLVETVPPELPSDSPPTNSLSNET
jgi:hypothetical protein